MFEGSLSFLGGVYSFVGWVIGVLIIWSILRWLGITPKRIVNWLWGDLSSEEWKKFLSLGGIFGLIIGIYWSLRPIKNSIFTALVGDNINALPYAKMASFLMIIPLVILYGKATAKFPREKMFYLLGSIYAGLALLLTGALLHPTYGLSGSDPSHFLGYTWYIYVESFGSLIVALFWAFASEITLPESAKKGFYIVTFFGQIGGMLGPSVLRAKHFGFNSSAPLLLIIAGLICLMMLAVRRFVSSMPAEVLVGYGKKEEPKEKAGFLEGLRLLISQPYLLGIFSVIAFFEIIATLLDFRFQVLAHSASADEIAYSTIQQNFAVWVNAVALISLILGVSKIQRKLGLSVSLTLLPILVGSAVIIMKWYPYLYVAFGIMVAVKAINYALNGPSLKQLYIPTSTDTKYKAGAWIEMFGSRGSKYTASQINMVRTWFLTKWGIPAGDMFFLAMTSYISLGFVAVWFFIALFLGRTHKKALQENKIIC